MMALAVHNFFKGRYSAKTTMYYLPVFQPTWLEVFPSAAEVPLSAHTNTRDYLTSYGIKILSEANLHTDPAAAELAEKIFQDLVLGNNGVTLQMTREAHLIMDLKERNMYAGAWLEVWLANRIHDMLGIQKTDIIQGLRISRSTQPNAANNEFDVMFEYKNRLFVGECKFYNNGRFRMGGQNGIAKEIYKLGNLRLNFGLHAIPFFITANVVEGIPQFEQACTFYGIKGTADKLIIRHDPDFSQFIHQLLR
jgi:hypothetical protein